MARKVSLSEGSTAAALGALGLLVAVHLHLACACAVHVLADEEVVHRLTMVSGRLDDPSRRWLGGWVVGGLRCTTIRFPNDASNVSLTNPALSFFSLHCHVLLQAQAL